MSKKICNVCKIKKDLEEFSRHRGKPTYRCKKCLSEYNKKYYIKNQEKIKQTVNEFKKENPNYMIEWRKNNKDKVTKQKKSWLLNNREKINSNERKRRKTDPAYRIKKNLRRRVNSIITRGCKSDNTLNLLGCSLYEFLNYLEKQFVEGMTWGNYGKEWHMDHIIPCSYFDLTKSEEQRKCFHFSNIRPLWAADNLKKSNKINHRLS